MEGLDHVEPSKTSSQLHFFRLHRSLILSRPLKTNAAGTMGSICYETQYFAIIDQVRNNDLALVIHLQSVGIVIDFHVLGQGSSVRI